MSRPSCPRVEPRPSALLCPGLHGPHRLRTLAVARGSATTPSSPGRKGQEAPGCGGWWTVDEYNDFVVPARLVGAFRLAERVMRLGVRGLRRRPKATRRFPLAEHVAQSSVAVELEECDDPVVASAVKGHTCGVVRVQRFCRRLERLRRLCRRFSPHAASVVAPKREPDFPLTFREVFVRF